MISKFLPEKWGGKNEAKQEKKDNEKEAKLHLLEGINLGQRTVGPCGDV